MALNTGDYVAKLTAIFALNSTITYPPKRFETRQRAVDWLTSRVKVQGTITPGTSAFGRVYLNEQIVEEVRPAPRPTRAPAKAAKPLDRLDAPPGLRCPARMLERAGQTGRRTYCGPWALMAITGRSFEEVRGEINRVRRRAASTPVKGVYDNEMRAVLRAYGVQVEGQPWAVHGGKTLAAVLRDRTPEQHAQTWLIVVSNHFVLVRGKKVTCAMLKCWTWISAAKKRRGVVKSITRIG